MLRTCLTLPLTATILAGLLAPASASADVPSWITPPPPAQGASNYEAKTGLLFVPFEEVTLSAICSGGVSAHSSNDCYSGLAADTTFPAWGDADQQTALMDALDAALAPYDVVITNERPPYWVPYMMLVMSDMAFDMSESETCVFAVANCDAGARNTVGLVTGDTMMCMGADPVMAGVHAFGRMSGLEGTDNAMDPMFSPPDWAMLSSGFQDQCDPLTTDPSQCSHIHKTYCMDDDTVQNGHQELLGDYGPRTEDTEAPVIDSIEPAEDMTITTSDSFSPTATLTENSNAVAVLWEITLPPDPDDPASMEQVATKCHNKAACDFDWNFTASAPPIEGPYDFGTVDPPWPGEYVVTFKAQDMYGNALEDHVVTITVEGSGGDGDTGDGGDDGGDDGADDGGDGDGSGTGTGDDGGDATGDDDSKGCGCNTTPAPGGAVLSLGLLALGMVRRRR